MDSSEQAVQSNEKLFFLNFKFVFEILTENQKIFKRVARRESAMCYISMDSTRQALQTNGKLFPNFGIIFRISYIFSILCM